ncbi:MAG: hypothetical protein M1820_003730 [Bogoriella megaspora]|nr:MAG: hypothetical protein M1820_003730 [Bogoriella megaspora]
MRPEKVSSWREQLPPPFDKSSPPLKRRGSTAQLGTSLDPDGGLAAINSITCRKRRNSAPGAVDQVDRSVNWLRFIHHKHAELRRKKSELAIEKLRRQVRHVSTSTWLTLDCESFSSVSDLELICKQSKAAKSTFEEPTRDELFALACECFPPIGESKVIINEYSVNALRTFEYTLEEVLASNCILQPGDLVSRVRWIYVEHYKMGTFWGSDYRFSQWGTDPALFEKSPILLLQDRLAELDQQAGRPPLEDEDIPGHKSIGDYYRQAPGCPEFLGLRVNSSTWLKAEPYDLLLSFLVLRPGVCKELQRNEYNDLQYGLSYINAVNDIRHSSYQAKPGLSELHRTAQRDGVHIHGSWDDNVERLEFYRAHTLLSCGSPRLYKVVADRLLRKEDDLRQHPDCALLYYTLARVSIENDEMMQDAPERALNQVFASLRNNRSASREHVEVIFSLQQAVLEGLEYLEENKRELPIWGIPPFDNHQVCFHPEHAPPPKIQDLIQKEMDLIAKDFDKIIGHWALLRSKVDRYLDVLLQFRVLEQQETHCVAESPGFTTTKSCDRRS